MNLRRVNKGLVLEDERSPRGKNLDEMGDSEDE